MRISRVGGIIAAANERSAFPLYQIGDTTAVKRIVMIFQQAGIFPVVILSGAEEDQVRYQLASSGVVFLSTEQGEPELFESAKTGLTFLQDICERVVFTPVNTPLFLPSTLSALTKAEGEIVSPSYQGRSGHPIAVSTAVIPEILNYQGAGGLRGALTRLKSRRQWIGVEDAGILQAVHREDSQAKLPNQYSQEFLHLTAELKLKKNNSIFDARTKLLLLLIERNHSVRTACAQMALSYSKGWEILNELESALGIKLVERRHGGTKGGRTTLSEQGIRFLCEYQRLEEEIQQHSEEKFAQMKASFSL